MEASLLLWCRKPNGSELGLFWCDGQLGVCGDELLPNFVFFPSKNKDVPCPNPCSV